MAISKAYTKVANLLDLQLDEKLLIGKLNCATPSSPNLGYMDVYFEIDDAGIVKAANPHEFSNDDNPARCQVFVRGGYESFEKTYSNNALFIFKGHLNAQSIEKGSCIYTCVYSQSGNFPHTKLTREYPFIAEISSTEFNAETIGNVVCHHSISMAGLDSHDTPCFFQINREAKQILGPLVANENDKNTYHGPNNRMTYDFWSPRSLSDYNSFLITYNGYEEHIADIRINGFNRLFLINLDSFNIGSNNKPRNQDFKLVDLIPENALINEFYRATSNNVTIKSFQKKKVQDWLNNKSLKLDKPRKSRLFALLSEFETDSESITELVKSILSSTEAEPLLRKIALEDADQFLERFHNKQNANIETLKIEIEAKKAEIMRQNDAVKKELASSQSKLVDVNKEKEFLQSEIDSKMRQTLENIEESEEYQTLLKEQTKELSELTKKLDQAKADFGNYEEAIGFQTEIQKLKIQAEFKRGEFDDDKKNFEGLIAALQTEAKQSTADLAKEYLKLQVVADIQNYDHFKYLEQSSNATKILEEGNEFFTLAVRTEVIKKDSINETRKAIIVEITERLKKMNRNISFDKVEAALIAIMQNQFTVLTGVPGSGKTSFAVQLGCALGCSKSTLVIPVAKDWNRPKDLMGYYNPISNTYESGSTNFYPFYKSLNSKSEVETTNSFLVLDEFNLSQPEFYMSNLTGLADNSVNRHINLGHNTNIIIPESNRFVCTANTDETVVSLSDRMISRCAFIQFDELPELDTAVNDLEFNHNLTPLLNGAEMIDLFSASTSDVISEELKNEIDSIVNACRDTSEQYGKGISITPRKYKQFLNFCKVMSVEEHGQARVLDFACTYFVLPLISGSGSQFKARLENVRNICEDLSLEEMGDQLGSIIVIGDANFENYRYAMG